MIELNISGRGVIELERLVCDVNGKLAVDGQLKEGVSRILSDLRDRLQIHLITADTHSRQDSIDHQLNIHSTRLVPGQESQQKAEFVRSLGADMVVPDIYAALELFEKPLHMVATLTK